MPTDTFSPDRGPAKGAVGPPRMSGDHKFDQNPGITTFRSDVDILFARMESLERSLLGETALSSFRPLQTAQDQKRKLFFETLLCNICHGFIALTVTAHSTT